MQRLNYSNVMATVAVFIALGGTSYAAVQITGTDIKNNSITSADIKDGTLYSRDFAPGQLPSGKQGDQGKQGIQGTQGAQGAKGDTGAKGDVGAQGPQGFTGATGPQGAGGGYYATSQAGTVTRARTTTVTTVPTGATIADIPFTSGATWTQPAGETDLIGGELAFTRPAGCNGNGPTVKLYLDGNVIGYADLGTTAQGSFTVEFDRQTSLASMSVARNHVLTAKVPSFNNCPNGTNFTIDSVSVDVTGSR